MCIGHLYVPGKYSAPYMLYLICLVIVLTAVVPIESQRLTKADSDNTFHLKYNWGCGSMAENLPGMHKVLYSIPSTI